MNKSNVIIFSLPEENVISSKKETTSSNWYLNYFFKMLLLFINAYVPKSIVGQEMKIKNLQKQEAIYLRVKV